MCSKNFCVQAKGGGGHRPVAPPKYATGLNLQLEGRNTCMQNTESLFIVGPPWNHWSLRDADDCYIFSRSQTTHVEITIDSSVFHKLNNIIR